MGNKPIRIAVYGDALLGLLERQLDGVFRYMREHPHLHVVDVRRSRIVANFKTDDPPWKGLADAAIHAIAFDGEDDPAVAAKWVERGGVPAVSTAADILHPRMATVCFDPKFIARLAADHLLQHGCRRFLHVGFYRSMGSRLRAEAWRQLLAKRGFALIEYDLRHELRFEGNDVIAPADAAQLGQLLEASCEKCGVLALNDAVARGVWRVCDQIGRAVPRQVAILGGQDSTLAFARHPTLSCICYPGEEIGFRAMTLLMRLAEGGRVPRNPVGVRGVKLIARESTLEHVEQRNDIASALEMIARHACGGLQVGQLVETLGVSRRWLELEFEKRVGRSPRQEIQRARLVQAKKMLELTELPIKQIAGMVGFAEPAALTNFFKNSTGLSPREFRASTRKGR